MMSSLSEVCCVVVIRSAKMRSGSLKSSADLGLRSKLGTSTAVNVAQHLPIRAVALNGAPLMSSPMARQCSLFGLDALF